MIARSFLKYCVHDMPVSNPFRLGAAIAAFLMMSLAAADNVHSPAADNDVSDLLATYPAGSIQSPEAADTALSKAAKARSRIQERYKREQRECYDHFFANACMDDAKERRRIALGHLRPVEIEAKAFKRHARVQERDQALATRNADNARTKPSTETPPPATSSESVANDVGANEADLKQDSALDAKISKRPGSAKKARVKSKKDPVDEAAEAEKREKKIAAYNKKIQKIQEHQREVAARKEAKNKRDADE